MLDIFYHIDVLILLIPKTLVFCFGTSRIGNRKGGKTVTYPRRAETRQRYLFHHHHGMIIFNSLSGQRPLIFPFDRRPMVESLRRKFFLFFGFDCFSRVIRPPMLPKTLDLRTFRKALLFVSASEPHQVPFQVLYLFFHPTNFGAKAQ